MIYDGWEKENQATIKRSLLINLLNREVTDVLILWNMEVGYKNYDF